MSNNLVLNLPSELLSLVVSFLNPSTLFSLSYVSQLLYTKYKPDHLVMLPLDKRYVMNDAISNGYIDLVKWLRENGCHWNQNTFNAAVNKGNLTILNYLRENHCPWGSFAYVKAVINKRFDIVKWLYSNGCPMDYRACMWAGLMHQIEMSRWLHEKRFPCDKRGCEYCDHND